MINILPILNQVLMVENFNMEYISTKKEKRTFRDIILSQLSKILELSCDEFRGGYTTKSIKGNFIEEVYVPDSRKRTIQSIEFFSYILKPHFKEDTLEKYNEIMERVSENLKQYENKEINYETFIINKLRCMIEIFEELNSLLSEREYWKGESYSDQLDDEGEELDD